MMRYAAVVTEAAMHTLADSLKVHMEEAHELFENISENSELQMLLNADEMKQIMKELEKVTEDLQTIK
jgi:NTP pyrophosphatase (non-canonical NTP hydrolase)